MTILPGIFGKAKRRTEPASHGVKPVSARETYNWDNCDPATNGEYFLIERYAATWGLCFDIGANRGDYARKVLDVNPSCRVICFEPNVALIESIKGKGIKEVYGLAVGERAGSTPFHVNDADSAMSSAVRKGENTRTIEVPVTSVDDFCREQGLGHVDFVKIDTEGFELQVLRGARDMCRRRAIDMIQFEYGGTYADASATLKEVYSLLQKDYIIGHIYPAGLLPVGYSSGIETYRYSNWIALSRDIFSW